MLTIGIDPGAEGAMVALDLEGRAVASWTADTGPEDTGGYYLDGDPDVLEVTRWIAALRDGPGVLRVVLETPFAPGRIGSANAITIGRRWGMHYAAVRAARVPVVTVTPAKWSADLFGGRKGATPAEKKAVAVRLVGERVPALTLRWGRRKNPHDGLADAACLALWGQR